MNHLRPPPSPPTSFGLEGLQALLPLLHRPVGQALECLRTGLASYFPRFQYNDRFDIITSYKIVTGLSSY